MKAIRIQMGILTLLCLLVFTSQAQENKQQPPAAQKQLTEKEQWQKQYNDLKPKLDQYQAKAELKASDNPDFDREVKKLNMVMTDFNSKIEKYDSATPEEKAQYKDMMKQMYARVQTQEKTVKEMYDKMKAEEKTPPKQ